MKVQQRQRVPQETNAMEESDLAQDEGFSVTTRGRGTLEGNGEDESEVGVEGAAGGD